MGRGDAEYVVDRRAGQERSGDDPRRDGHGARRNRLAAVVEPEIARLRRQEGKREAETAKQASRRIPARREDLQKAPMAGARVIVTSHSSHRLESRQRPMVDGIKPVKRTVLLSLRRHWLDGLGLGIHKLLTHVSKYPQVSP